MRFITLPPGRDCKAILFFFLLSPALFTYSQSSKIEELILEGKKISIYVPPGLKKGQTYPVLLFTDGQTCFGNSFNSLGLERMADSLIKMRLIEPVFIAGIHSNQDRMSQYIPYVDSSIFQDFGYYEPQSEAFINFIKTSLLPELEMRYPINKKTGIAGFSFGGLLASWAAIHHTDLFSFAAAFSPSMWVDDFRIFKEASLLKPTQSFYMDIGTAEWNYYLPFV
ncbi:MAG: alpha/beta hydrolase, partial [Flavisolibacter sp.]